MLHLSATFVYIINGLRKSIKKIVTPTQYLIGIPK